MPTKSIASKGRSTAGKRREDRKRRGEEASAATQPSREGTRNEEIIPWRKRRPTRIRAGAESTSCARTRGRTERASASRPSSRSARTRHEALAPPPVARKRIHRPRARDLVERHGLLLRRERRMPGEIQPDGEEGRRRLRPELRLGARGDAREPGETVGRDRSPGVRGVGKANQRGPRESGPGERKRP